MVSGQRTQRCGQSGILRFRSNRILSQALPNSGCLTKAMAHQGKLQSLALTTDAVSSRRLPSTRLTDRAALLAGKGSFANVGDWKDEKLAEERKKGKLRRKGPYFGRSNPKSSLAVWGGGLPAMIAINNAGLKLDFQIVKVPCSSLQCLVHRTNQFPERLRTWLILIRRLATHLAHWEASWFLHSPRHRQFCLVGLIQ